MKRTFILIGAVVVLLFLTQQAIAATPPLPAEVKQFMLKFIEAMTQHSVVFIEESENATAPEQMARAIENYHQGIQPLIEDMVKLKAKYLDFFTASEKEENKSSGDAELDKANAGFEKRMENFGTAMAKAMQWMGHPKVKAAMDKIQATMSKLDDKKDSQDGA